MLKSILIRNYVLIDSLNISFEDGFSVLTGETGAGKSIILGALGLVLGQRADTKIIQSNSEKCIIEAIFDISAYNLESFFTANDLEYDASDCIIRRELSISGKSRAFINDTPASLTVIKSLGDSLIDIHSQHQNLLLSDAQFQLKVIDLMGGTSDALKSYKEEYTRYRSLTSQLEELTVRAAKTKANEEFVRFQSEELSSAQLRAGEQLELERELETLSHAEEIKKSLYSISNLLNSEETGIIKSLKESLSVSEGLLPYYPKAEEFANRIRGCYLDLKDLGSELSILKEDIEFQPSRMEQINDRLSLLYSLQQKHHVTSESELIALHTELSNRLQEISSFDEEIASLTEAQQSSYRLLMDRASELTMIRKKSAQKIEPQLVSRLVTLGMPNTRFSIEITPRTAPSSDGMDEISFLFSANKNEPLKSVSQTASGGEISRLMLCIKAMISSYASLPTIIFDEIDTGTSGEIASKMGDIMREMGTSMQVITITHLPQIASKGLVQYHVYKEDTADRTHTRIRRLSDTERIEEIGRMLSGAVLTESALANAKELLKKSKR